MNGPAGLRVLITGATSGLGKEMAVQFSREGCRLALTGRREEKLNVAAELARSGGAECLALLGNVTDLAQVKSQYARIREKWGGLDWAILNAGVGDSRSARRFSAENYRCTFDTNVMGVANWIEAVLPDMLAARSGTIAGIASLAAYRGMPNSGAYSASKAALVTLLESTRIDLRGTGVDVVTVCPGYVRSEMTDRNDPRDMMFLLETDDGARRIIEGIRRKKRLVHFPWQLSYAAVHLVSNLPSWLFDRLVVRFAHRGKKPYVDETRI